MTLHLHGLGHFHPENEITNRFLEELEIGTDDAWVIERVGIRSRRTVLPLDYIRSTRNREPRAALEAALYGNAEMGRRAALLAMHRAGVTKDDIGLVIAGSSAADTASPAEACNIARALELEVPAFDIASACTSFLAQLHWLSYMDPGRMPDFVLLVVPEGLTRCVDYSDRSAAVLWGDAAVAAVVSTHIPGRARLLGTSFGSNPLHADKVLIPRLGHFRQQGRVVQAFAIRRTAQLLDELRVGHTDPERVLHFVGHQANLRMLESVCRISGIAPERHHHNVELFGNTAAASAPSVISMAWEKWDTRDDVAIAAVGAGLSWSRCLWRFGAVS